MHCTELKSVYTKINLCTLVYERVCVCVCVCICTGFERGVWSKTDKEVDGNRISSIRAGGFIVPLTETPCKGNWIQHYSVFRVARTFMGAFDILAATSDSCALACIHFLLFIKQGSTTALFLSDKTASMHRISRRNVIPLQNQEKVITIKSPWISIALHARMNTIDGPRLRQTC